MFSVSLFIWAFVYIHIIIDTEALQLLGSYDIHKFNEISDQLCLERWQSQIDLRGRDIIKIESESDFSKTIKALNVSKENTLKNLMVHVGKTGGSTITSMLHQHKVPFQQLHVHSLDSIMVDTFDTIILSLRDPVQRIVSAFHFSNPLIPQSEGYVLHTPVKTFYSCNPDLNTFADNLVMPTECGSVARNFSNHSHEFSHISYDTCAYIRGVFDLLKYHRNKVYIINQESLIEDMNKLSAKKKWNVIFKDPPHFNKFLKTAVNISPLAYIKLAGYLELSGEMGFYNKVQREFGNALSSRGEH